MNIQEILDSFTPDDGIYKRKAVEAALARKAEIIPYLASIIAKMVESPEDLLNRKGSLLHIYSILLLAHFRETTVHKILIDLFSLPGDMTRALFGDLVFEHLSSVLYRTCGGNFDSIKEFIGNKDVYAFSRATAVESLMQGIVNGDLQRQDVLDYLEGFLKNRHSEAPSIVHGVIAAAIVDLYPVGYEELLYECIDDGYVDDRYFNKDLVKCEINKGKAACLKEVKESCSRLWDDDNFHGLLENWDCFDTGDGREFSSEAKDITDTILKCIMFHPGVYPEKMINLVLGMKDAVAPILLDFLKKTLTNPLEFAENSQLTGHIYGLILLSHFKEASAHKTIVELMSLEEKVLDDLFGDIVTTFLPAILFRTCGGNFDSIKELILNSKAYEFSRASAVESLAFGVAAGLIDRKDVVEFFQTFLLNRHSEPWSYVFNDVVKSLIDICPVESIELIKETIDDGYLQESQQEINFLYDEMDDAIDKGQEACLEKIKQDLAKSWDDNNVHVQLNSMFCPIVYNEPDDDDYREEKLPSQEEKKKKKKLKKLKKASKKQNRKKKRKK